MFFVCGKTLNHIHSLAKKTKKDLLLTLLFSSQKIFTHEHELYATSVPCPASTGTDQGNAQTSFGMTEHW
jgi:hypothetical protein